MNHLNQQTMFLINSVCLHQVFFHKELHHDFRKLSEITNFTKLSLGVKPPLKNTWLSHNVKFSKSGVLVGG